MITDDEFSNHITYLNIEKGKIVVEFREVVNEYPNQFRAKMDELAYQRNENIQLALLTMSNNPQVTIKCCISMDWNDFLAAVNRDNNPISSSLWRLDDNSPAEVFIIEMDAMSYYQIKQRGDQLNINGSQYVIEVIDNQYNFDVTAVEALNI